MSYRSAGVLLVWPLLLVAPEQGTAQELNGSPAPHSPGTARVVVFQPRVLRYLALQYYHYSDEFGACLVGDRRGDSLFVTRADPGDFDPTDVTPTTVNWRRSCEESAPGALGTIHSHLKGQNCYFELPKAPPVGRIRIIRGGDSVWTVDAVFFFERARMVVTAIMCGDRIVWMGRDSVTRVLVLPDSLRPVSVAQRKRRNR